MADIPVEWPETLLAITVDVGGERVAGLLRGLEERGEQRVGGRAAFKDQRPVAAAELRVLLRPLHLLEIGQAMRVVPVLHAGVRGPPLIVERVAALEDHAIDTARATQELATRMVDPAGVEIWLRLGLVLPVVEPISDREGQRARHM